MAPLSPEMRAMPSPTLSTVPISRRSSGGSKSSIWRRNCRVMSSTRIAIGSINPRPFSRPVQLARRNTPSSPRNRAATVPSITSSPTRMSSPPITCGSTW